MRSHFGAVGDEDLVGLDSSFVFWARFSRMDETQDRVEEYVGAVGDGVGTRHLESEETRMV
jgi:hypothetical protein